MKLYITSTLSLQKMVKQGQLKRKEEKLKNAAALREYIQTQTMEVYEQ